MGIRAVIKDSLISARSTWVRKFYLIRGRPKKLNCWEGRVQFRHVKLEMPLGHPSDVKKAVGYVRLERDDIVLLNPF